MPTTDPSALSRRGLLAGGAAAAGLAWAAGPTPPARSRNLVVVWAAGGWDTTYALDPKPGVAGVDAPVDGALRAFGDLDVWVAPSRPSVEAFFDAWWPTAAVVRGIDARSIAHEACSTRMLTGTRSARSPDLAAIAAHQLGRDRPIPYLVFGDWAFVGPYAVSTGRVGTTGQLRSLLDPAQAWRPPPDASWPRLEPTEAERALVRDHARARAEREYATRGSQGYNRARIDDFLVSLDRAEALRPRADAFGAAAEIVALQAQVDLAVGALARGVSRCAMLDSRLRWDTHAANDQQDAFHEALFAGLVRLAEGLDAAPGESGGTLLDETVVAVLSDMGRTPRLNGADADAGKDHWPITSALLFGAGVAGGTVCGATDDATLALPVDLDTGEPRAGGEALLPEHLLAGIVELVGADPTPHLDVTPLRGFVA